MLTLPHQEILQETKAAGAVNAVRLSQSHTTVLWYFDGLGDAFPFVFYHFSQVPAKTVNSWSFSEVCPSFNGISSGKVQVMISQLMV